MPYSNLAYYKTSDKVTILTSLLNYFLKYTQAGLTKQGDILHKTRSK